jgi:uncharacterized membrane protein YfcA
MMWIVLGAILITSFISGILGMAGGMILIGVLSILLPVASAMILHGVTQMGSNGFRAYLLREHIKLSVLPTYILGALVGFGIFSALSFVPSKGLVLIAVGIFPFIAILAPQSIPIDIMKGKNSFACGVVVTSAQILAGASGPILDVFFIKSSLTRHEIIATKAITQTIGHLIKLVYYGQILYSTSEQLEVPYLLFPAAVICAFLGTQGGKSVLDRLSELQFQKYSRLVIALICGFYILKGLVSIP